MKDKIIGFLKKEVVLVVATILAILSAFIIPPTKAYLAYIDWRVLGLLLCLMTVMAGMQKIAYSYSCIADCGGKFGKYAYSNRESTEFISI